VMDGRVDNWTELRGELLARGAILRTKADAELVLRAYEVWGEECVHRIVGECVFFVYNTASRTLFGTRDALGTRHFFFYVNQNFIAFASEIRALFTLPIPKRLNEMRVLDFLVVQYDRVDQINTMYRDIVRLPAGHSMSVRGDTVRTWRWWNVLELEPIRMSSGQEVLEAYRHHFKEAIAPRLRHLKPVASMLSGGLDSSSIVGLISSEFRSSLASGLHTISLTRANGSECFDWPHIKSVLAANTWLVPHVVTSNVISERYLDLEARARQADEPFELVGGWTDQIVFDEAKAQGCGVVLDGMAGDLHFFSNARSLDAVFREGLWSELPSVLKSYGFHGTPGAATSIVRKLLRRSAPRRFRTWYDESWRNDWLTPQSSSAHPGDLSDILNSEIAREYLLHRQSQGRKTAKESTGDSNTRSHARIFETGAVSFAHEVNGRLALGRGIEPRSPFSDKRFVEFAITMPTAFKLARNRYKESLRQISTPVLPASVVDRKNIAGHPGSDYFERLQIELRTVNRQRSDLGWEALLRWCDHAKLTTLFRGESLDGLNSTKLRSYDWVVAASLNHWLSCNEDA
jgi:asparagine synthase (glutamine-hydrolysing)